MKNIWYLGILTILTISCSSSQDKPQCSNLSNLIPHIELKRICDPCNQIIQTTQVSFTDTDGNWTELPGGFVEIDDQNLELTPDQCGYPYYSITNNESLFEAGSEHTLKITTSDGESYDCQITFPYTRLNKLILPSQHSIDNDLIIHWEGIDQTPKILVWSDSKFSPQNSGSISIPDDTLDKGIFLLPKENISLPFYATFSLITYSYGRIDPQFPDGEIIALWIVQANCMIHN